MIWGIFAELVFRLEKKNDFGRMGRHNLDDCYALILLRYNFSG